MAACLVSLANAAAQTVAPAIRLPLAAVAAYAVLTAIRVVAEMLDDDHAQDWS
mgnify:CR=1 FL=1